MHLLYCFALVATIGFVGLAPANAFAGEMEPPSNWQQLAELGRWWPHQQIPVGLVILDATSFSGGGEPSFGPLLNPDHMLAQSLAGLAAAAVNEGVHDELVWIETPSEAYAEWFERMQEQWVYEVRGKLDVWELLARYTDAGLVRGYILYRFDRSEGPVYEAREGSDRSVNAATVAAGVERAVLIDESQEERAQALGLERLVDARGRDEAWAFGQYRDRLNNTLLLTQEPRVPHNRALAIAHRAMVCFGTDETLHRALEWLAPLSPIIGWNKGDESGHTLPVTEWGHFQTASNWAFNLTVLSAGSERVPPRPARRLDPASLTPLEDSPMAAFLMSDGDNVQWQLGNFFHGPHYWANPAHGDYPMGWTMCMTQLVQAAPYAAHKAAEELPVNASLSEHGGGYYYPDRFAVRRADRWALLRAHARRVGANMQLTGVPLLSFICKDVDSDDAQRSYRIFAEEMPGLVGMLAYQYHPYEGGFGAVYWVSNADGVEIPVVTARFSIWELQRSATAGTPAKVARMLNQLGTDDPPPGSGDHAVVAVHAWSRFLHAPGDDETAEELPRHRRDGNAAFEQGLLPAHRAAERVRAPVRVVTPEELIWRLREERRSDKPPAVPVALP